MRFSRNEHKKLTGHVYFRGRPRLTLDHKIHESLSRLSVKSTVHHTLVLALTNCKQQRSPSYLVFRSCWRVLHACALNYLTTERNYKLKTEELVQNSLTLPTLSHIRRVRKLENQLALFSRKANRLVTIE